MAKHHDGFCLWPSRHTDYSVKSSPWSDGKGDLVGEVAAACRKHWLKFGVYLSPWDRHESSYKDNKAYDEYYMKQVSELATRYGELVEFCMRQWYAIRCTSRVNGPLTECFELCTS